MEQAAASHHRIEQPNSIRPGQSIETFTLRGIRRFGMEPPHLLKAKGCVRHRVQLGLAAPLQLPPDPKRGEPKGVRRVVSFTADTELFGQLTTRPGKQTGKTDPGRLEVPIRLQTPRRRDREVTSPPVEVGRAPLRHHHVIGGVQQHHHTDVTCELTVGGRGERSDPRLVAPPEIIGAIEQGLERTGVKVGHGCHAAIVDPRADGLQAKQCGQSAVMATRMGLQGRQGCL